MFLGSLMEADILKLWLDFIGKLIWPVVFLIFVFLFKNSFAALVNRLKSGEVAGAKLTFNEAASGLIESKVDSIAHENNPDKRQKLAAQVKDIAHTIGAIHPISLSLLIEGADNMHWVGAAYTDKKHNFAQLELAGLAQVKEKQNQANKLEATLKILPKGKILLTEIGYYTDLIKT